MRFITDPRTFNWTNEQLERAYAAAAGKEGQARIAAVAGELSIALDEARELLEVHSQPGGELPEAPNDPEVPDRKR